MHANHALIYECHSSSSFRINLHLYISIALIHKHSYLLLFYLFWEDFTMRSLEKFNTMPHGGAMFMRVSGGNRCPH
jgi:hypothetical protein